MTPSPSIFGTPIERVKTLRISHIFVPNIDSFPLENLPTYSFKEFLFVLYFEKEHRLTCHARLWS